MPEDSSQNTALSPEDSSLVMDTHVTADATALDNATHAPTEQTPQQVVVTDSTGEDVDDSGTKTHAQRLSEYQARKAAMFSGKAPEEAPAAPNPPPAVKPVTAPQATDTEDEFPAAPTDGRMPKIKLQAVTPVDVQAMAEFKAHQRAGGTQSFVDFINIRFPAAPVAAKEGVSGTDGVPNSNEATGQEPATVAELDALLAQKKADRRTALKEFDFDRVEQLEDEEETLRGKRDGLLQSESQQQNAAQQAWETQETEYLTKVGRMFPQSKNASDPLVLRANELLNEWYDAKDPRASHPSRSMLCYVEAATEMGVTPSATAAPLKQSSTSSPVHRAPITAVIASGNANQTQTREQVDTRTYEQRKADYLAATSRNSSQQRVA